MISQAVAETIANNVRSTIIKEHLNDPAYSDLMSKLLEEIIEDLRARRVDYAAYLHRIADLAKRVVTGMADDTPERLKRSAALRALYNNLDKDEGLAIRLDEVVRATRPDDWRGNQPRENTIKAALLPLMGGDVAQVERIFLVIKQQPEY